MGGASGSWQPIARVCDNTIDTGTIPIIFSPGIMGTRLHFTSISEYWDPDSKWRMSHWLTTGTEKVRREFALSNPATVMSEGKGYTAEQLERGWAGVAGDFYKGLLEHLEKHAYGSYNTPVYAVGYDWRQNNNTSGDAIMARIAEILELEHAEKYILLSHSMGGLATRAGLKRHPDVAKKALGVCHIAQPVTGAAVAARRMFTGATYGGDGVLMMALLGNSRQKFTTIASSLPGAIQLLPTQDFTNTGGGAWYTYKTFERPNVDEQWGGMSWDLFASPQSPPGLVAPADSRHTVDPVPRREIARRIQEARTFHLGLGLFKHDRTWTFYGDGNTTDTSLHFELPPLHAEFSIWQTALHSLNPFSDDLHYTAKRADGSEVTVPGSQVDPANRGCVLKQTNRSDGTVPIASAQALFPGQAHKYKSGAEHDLEKQRQFFHHGGAQHDKICTDPPTLAFVDELITHLVGSV
jgi:pimeloyl-ACP methyl ester carboxylesterase